MFAVYPRPGANRLWDDRRTLVSMRRVWRAVVGLAAATALLGGASACGSSKPTNVKSEPGATTTTSTTRGGSSGYGY
jgi:hypothetical protein